MKKLFFLLLVLSMASLNAQSDENGEKLIGIFLKAGQAKVIGQSEKTPDLLDLKYEGFQMMPEEILGKVEFFVPTYLLVNTKVKPGKKVPQTINKNVEKTNLLLSVDEQVSFIFQSDGQRSKWVNNKGEISEFYGLNIADVKQEENGSFEFGDYNSNYDEELPVYTYINTKTDEKYKLIYVLSKSANSVGILIAPESNFTKKESYGVLRKKEIEKYADLKSVFKKDSLYVYKVGFENDKAQNRETLAFSNLNPNEITLEDFSAQSEYHHVSQYNYKAIDFELYTQYELMDIEGQQIGMKLNAYLINPIKSRHYDYWDESTYPLDERIADEQIDVITNPQNYKKYTRAYFEEKFGQETFTNREMTLKISFETFTDRNEPFYKLRFDIGTINDDKRPYYEIARDKEAKRIYDLWSGLSYIDSYYLPTIEEEKTEDFRFVIVMDDFLNDPSYQMDSDKLLSTLASSASNNLQGYWRYLKAKEDAEKRNKAEIQKLYNQYGKKYVDEALNGNIIEGMPQDLTAIPLKLWSLDYTQRHNSTMIYYYYSKLDTSVRMALVIRDKKVYSISVY